jgi:hypothetical protein
MLLVRQYCDPNSDGGFTKEDIQKNIHTIYQDVECSECKFILSRPLFQSIYGDYGRASCPKCGE